MKVWIKLDIDTKDEPRVSSIIDCALDAGTIQDAITESADVIDGGTFEITSAIVDKVESEFTCEHPNGFHQCTTGSEGCLHCDECGAMKQANES